MKAHKQMIDVGDFPDLSGVAEELGRRACGFRAGPRSFPPEIHQ